MIEQYRLYLRAAKLKNADPSAIFESAATDPNLNAKQLGQLASVLGERHGYRLPKSMRDPLIDRLLEAGVKAQRISDLTGCHPRTVARRQAAQVGSTNGMDKRCRPDKTAARGVRVENRQSVAYGPPIRSFDATSGWSVLRGGRQ